MPGFLRWFLRDWKAGELNLLLACVALTVAVLTCTALLSERLRLGLGAQSAQLLGADLVVASDRPIHSRSFELARKHQLKSSQTVVFPSMIMAEGSSGTSAPTLVSVKAVSAGYPLRGQLELQMAKQKTTENSGQAQAQSIPKPGEAWVDSALREALGGSENTSVQLGNLKLNATQTIVLETDRGTNFMNMAPRLMINIDDLAASGLVQTGSRLVYRLQLSGDAAGLAGFQKEVVLGIGERLESLDSGRPETRKMVQRAESFLSLVNAICLAICACALALAAQRFAARHVDSFAILRAIGSTQKSIAFNALGEIITLGVVGAIAGAMVGYLAQIGLVKLMSSTFSWSLPQAGLTPVLQSVVGGITLLCGFAVVPILRVAGISPLRVLRRDLGARPMSIWLAGGFALGCFGLLLWWITGDSQLTILLLAGLLAAMAVFLLLSYVLLRLIIAVCSTEKFRHNKIFGHGLLGVVVGHWRNQTSSVVMQVSVLSLSVFCLVVLTVTRTELLDGWRASARPDAPNHFVINVQADQVQLAGDVLAAQLGKPVDLVPMVRGRLLTVNSRTVAGVDRELNLSFATKHPEHNKTVVGRWIDPSAAEVSVEAGFAKSLQLNLGDSVSFDIAGETVSARVVGIRKLAWDSMQANFFMIFSPKVLASKPVSYMAAVYVPDSLKNFNRELLQKMPNLTVFDARQITQQVLRMVNQLSTAVQFLFLFALLAGLLVLFASLLVFEDERKHQAALLRALGASKRQLVNGQRMEFLLLGSFSGLIASTAGLLLGVLLSRFVFDLQVSPSWWAIPSVMLITALCTLVAGRISLRAVLNTSPIESLRHV